MEWASRYTPDKQPGENEISQFVNSDQWAKIHAFLRDNYGIKPEYSYSSCSAQPGWNVKFKKAGRSLCTLYPMEGYFIALVVIGAKEMTEAEIILPTLREYTRDLFENTVFSAGGKWLMISVTNEEILKDVKRLIELRRKINKKQ